MLFGIDSLYFWLAVIIISIAAEAATLGLCGIWFAAGGAAALVAATFGASIWMQLVIFVLLSAVMLLLVRPLFSRFLKAGRQARDGKTDGKPQVFFHRFAIFCCKIGKIEVEL